ncbi:hypothetical protein B9Z65_6337 [Elsinoe australis]|uniref:Urease accessory protein UreF n=1 Tax=Elsinoe australis TaxID=40998 RepID=A0A2P8A8C5_9PEZI|nr:hypothetical protein B9Z65_6337 [Elsinoe australis]
MTSSLHALLLLSDSALPLGSFAFSSGLESYLAHSKHQFQSQSPSPSTTRPRTAHCQPQPWKPTPTSLHLFLHHSLHNQASTALPFVLAAHRSPHRLLELDDILDASTACTVARRASTAQGRALASLWTRALRDGITPSETSAPALDAVETYIATFTSSAIGPGGGAGTKDGIEALLDAAPQAHLPPLFGAVTRAMGLAEEDAAYVFLLNHAKAVLSAAVRAGVMGPYQSQAVLAGREVEGWILGVVEEVRSRGRREGTVEGENRGTEGDEAWRLVEEAGVSIPAMDLWMGRHEVLYSRIFNS